MFVANTINIFLMNIFAVKIINKELRREVLLRHPVSPIEYGRLPGQNLGQKNVYLNIFSLNDSAKISCDLQLIILKMSVKWRISTVLFVMKIHKGEPLVSIPFSVIGTQFLLAEAFSCNST